MKPEDLTKIAEDYCVSKFSEGLQHFKETRKDVSDEEIQATVEEYNKEVKPSLVETFVLFLKWLDRMYLLVKRTDEAPDMNNHYCSYALGLRLKEKGFNWPCREYWCEDGRFDSGRRSSVNSYPYGLAEHCEAPSLDFVAQWLREVHGIHIQMNAVIGQQWSYDLVDLQMKADISGELYSTRIEEKSEYSVFKTYTEAMEDAINKALDVITYEPDENLTEYLNTHTPEEIYDNLKKYGTVMKSEDSQDKQQ